jgi:exodeoxyribonuclease V gamma subunit
MPASVFPHQDFESLLAALPSPGNPKGPALQPVVVPSLTFGDYIQGRIADRFGICMGMEFLMPQDFVHRAVGPGQNSPWSKRRLVWRVLPHVAAYSSQLGISDVSPRDRFALAGLLADRIDQYGHFRPELIRCWAERKWAKEKPAEHEEWQRELWEKLRDEIGDPPPALAMALLKKNPDARNALAERYPDLLVLGTGALDPLLVEVLQLLSGEGSRVTVHVVLPSLKYLGDLRRRGLLPEEDLDPEDIAIDGGHPLLESMGRHAIGAFHLLGKLDDQYTCWPEVGNQPENCSSLLLRVQSDVRSLHSPVEKPGTPNDSSLRVHSCFGPRREMEVLRDELLRAFDELENLKPDEVRIVTPDLETYAPLVSAVLRQGNAPLPVRLCELPPGGGDPMVEGMVALLGMAHSGRFEAAEVLDLVEKPSVLAALNSDDAAILRRWVRDSGLTHGLGDAGPGTATFSRNRLIAGRWFGQDSPARYPDDTFVLPVADQIGGDLELGDHFSGWLASLEATMDTWKMPVPAKEWSARLGKAGQDLLGDPDGDARAIVALTTFLDEQEDGEPLDAGAILDWVQAECAESGRRARLSGGIAFGQFKQLQNLPCRVLAMVGMQDANFPSRNRAPAWDLLKAGPRVWDRNPRIDDRQLFLDALLTPAERLIITAGTRNIRTMESEPFSSCVDELLRVAAAMGGGRPVTEQRLQPFVADYFRDNLKLPRSYDAFHAGVAERLQSGERILGVPFWNAEVEAAQKDGVEITACRLAGFWKDPAAAFIKACQILLPREEAADEELNRSPLAIEGLQSWGLKNGILQEMLTNEPECDFLRDGMAATRQLPPGKLAEFSWSKGMRLAGPVAESVKKQLGEKDSLEYEVAPGIRITADLMLSKDKETLLTYQTGEAKKAEHYLAAWINAMVATACGRELPTLLFDEARAETPATLDAIPAEEAKATLAILVNYYQEGQGRPLCFAPEASDALIKKLNGKGGDADSAVAAAEKKWSAEDSGFGGGEGQEEAARLAWRDRNPFEEPEEWVELAEAVSAPLRAWGGFK